MQSRRVSAVARGAEMMLAGEDPLRDRSGETWVDVGRIGRPFGLKGEVVIQYPGETPELFAPGSEVFLVMKDGRRPLRVAACRRMPKKFVARFECCERIEDVEPLVGCMLQVQARDLPSLGKDGFYHYELIGLKVYAADGRYVGILEEILDTKGNDVYCVRHEGREVLVPAIRDAIEKIDPGAGRMILKNLEGLIEQ